MASNILPTLDFNAVHCRNPLSRTYYGLAAIEIRTARREADYWKHQCQLEKARRVEGDKHAALLASILDRIIDDMPDVSGPSAE